MKGADEPMRRWVDVGVGAWILVVSISLLCNLDTTTLWQDEAESALNALSINSENFIPKGAAHAETALLHEMACYYRTNDSKYEYLPTHYMFTSYVTIHGWLPYYFIRAGIELFGKNEFGPRFFSVVFYALSLGCLYLIIRSRPSQAIAIGVVVYCSLMPTMLGYVMQARWYSYALFFSLYGLFTFLRFLEKMSRSSFFSWAISEALLFYTFASAFVVHQIVFILFVVFFKRHIFKPFMIYCGLLSIALLPHLLITKLPLLATKIPARNTIDLKSIFMMIAALEWNPILVILAIVSIGMFIMHSLKSKLKMQNDAVWNFNLLSLLYILSGYIILSYTSLIVSFYPRIYIVLIPIVVYFAFLIVFPKTGDRRRIVFLKSVTFALMIVFLLTGPLLKSGSSRVWDLFRHQFKPNHFFTTNADWVPEAIKLINSTDAENPLIITSFEHYVFSYYSDYESDLIWPLRKDFIDNTNRHLFIIAESDKDLTLHCELFLPEEKECCKTLETMKFYNRIQGCKETHILGVRVFDCPPKQ
jgi:hypothetical protein